MQYRWISKGYRDYRRVRIAYRIKAVFATVILILAIAFAVALYRAKDAGGEYTECSIVCLRVLEYSMIFIRLLTKIRIFIFNNKTTRLRSHEQPC